MDNTIFAYKWKKIGKQLFFIIYECESILTYNEAIKCIKNTINLNYESYTTIFVFNLDDKRTIEVKFYRYDYEYCVKEIDKYGRELNIIYQYNNFKLCKTIKKCDGLNHCNYEPAIIDYNTKGKVQNAFFYIHGKYVRKDKFKKLEEKVNNLNFKYINKFKLNNLILYDQIAMDIDNEEIHNKLKEAIEIKLIVKKMEDN